MFVLTVLLSTGTTFQRWLSRHVSIVSQEPTLFGRSIKRNIMYGLEGTPDEPSDEEIERIAKLANAHDFIVVCILGIPVNIFFWH